MALELAACRGSEEVENNLQGFSSEALRLLPPLTSSTGLGHGNLGSAGGGKRSWRGLRGQSLAQAPRARSASSRAEVRKTAFQWPVERNHSGKNLLSPRWPIWLGILPTNITPLV